MATGAGGRGRLRASDADRERVIELLKGAFVQGWLAKDAFDARVGQVLASRTYAELEATTAGLPAGLAGVRPSRIRARAHLGGYAAGGRHTDAIGPSERTLADRERVQGRDHRDTLTARANLAACYQLARRLTEAIPAYKHGLADSERMLGPSDIETLTTRRNLASAYYMVGRVTEVVVILQRALTDCERYLGPDHPMTRTARVNLDAATLA